MTSINGVVDLVIAQKPSEMGSTAVQYGGYTPDRLKPVHSEALRHGYVVIDKTNVNDPGSQGSHL